MIDWLVATTPLFKAAHIATLSLWCAGLVALPLMLSRHDPAVGQADYNRIRRYLHLTYTIWVTPAAVIAVITGTWLVFLREVFVPWMFLKLVFVALLLTFHGWVGHIIVMMVETAGTHDPPNPVLPLLLLMVPVLAILFLVLAKPYLGWIEFPDWLTEPRGGQFPFEVPRR
jgi:protoporphyrinogen IX oxidase